MNKNEIKDIVVDEIRKFTVDNLDKEVSRLLRNSSSKSRDEIISIIKSSLESAFKTLWQKRDFWKTDIK